MSRLWIGIDVGGTGIKGAVVDGNGVMLREKAVETSSAEGTEGILGRIAGVIGNLADGEGEIAGIGIGSAGRIDRNAGTVLYATGNLPGWTGLKLAERIADSFRLPVHLDNDANMAALGEGWIGAAAGLRDYALLTLGTGVGGALVYRNEVISGRSGSAGEIGHVCLHPGGLPCNCGSHGCVEQYVSGKALNRIANGVLPSWDSYRLLQAYEEGQPEAVTAMEAFFRDLCLTIRNLQTAFDPEAVIVGGGVADARAAWWSGFKRLWAADQPDPVPLIPAALGNKAGMIGAARLAMMGGYGDGGK